MKHVSYGELRQNLAKHLDEAVGSRAPVLVTRQAGKEGAVILSEAEFSAWQETIHLLRSPANAARLQRSIREADDGQSVEKELQTSQA